MNKKKTRIFTILGEFFILSLSLSIVFLALSDARREHMLNRISVIAGIMLLWCLISFLNGKYFRGKVVNITTLFRRVLVSNFITLLIMAVVMIISGNFRYHSSILLATALIATMLELTLGSIYVAYKRAELQNIEEVEQIRIFDRPGDTDLIGEVAADTENGLTETTDREVVEALQNECGPELTASLLTIAGTKLKDKVAVLSSNDAADVSKLPLADYTYMFNLRRINDIPKLDTFLENINGRLADRAYLLCCVETKDQRKQRFLSKLPPLINYFLYTLDFVVMRVLPKFKPTIGIYNLLTKGENRVISRAEALGRISRAGFRIKNESVLEGLLCIEARKSGQPLPHDNNRHSTLIALQRVGKDGELIKVYKLRTMHPYSEYIQDYVYSLYDLKEGGKFNNDFRITSWGALARKAWLDEIPMLFNILRGEMKLIGVRPLSRHYFSLYRDEVQKKRIKHKPGLIPPYYADLPTNLDEIQDSEMRYLDRYEKSPFCTDFCYFWRSVRNILIRHARSQ